MKRYTFTCTCGDKMSVDASDLEEAKTKFREMMTESAAKFHFDEKHPGEEFPPYDALIENAIANLSEEEAQDTDDTMIN